jgi:hypothetical protein
MGEHHHQPQERMISSAIFYDDSPSPPRAEDYLIRLRRIIRLKPTCKKIQFQAKW